MSKKQPGSKDGSKEDFEKELEGLIEQNENMAKGIKKIISSFNDKKPKK